MSPISALRERTDGTALRCDSTPQRKTSSPVNSNRDD
jgi:hypothetical protein